MPFLLLQITKSLIADITVQFQIQVSEQVLFVIYLTSEIFLVFQQLLTTGFGSGNFLLQRTDDTL